jgi:hypothetical protein
VVCRTTQFPGKDILGMVRNVGAGGLMAEFPVLLMRAGGAQLWLQTQRGSLAVDARVVWNAAGGDMIRHGLAFLTAQGPGLAEDLLQDERRWEELTGR